MTINTKTYTLELNEDEFATLHHALTFAYNTLWNRAHPEDIAEDETGFYEEAAERHAPVLLENHMDTLKRITHTVQNESGSAQSW